MRRMMTRGLALLFCLSILVSTAVAAEPNQVTERIDYEDGSFLTITTRLYPALTRASSLYATKEISYTDAAGDLCFAYTLRGWFTYGNNTSQATNAAAIIDLYKRGWTVSTHNEYCSGNTAYGSATFKGPTGPRSVSISLTCDRYGNVT